MRERAPQKYMYFQVSKYRLHTYTITAVVWHYDWQNTNMEEKTNMRAERSERA